MECNERVSDNEYDEIRCVGSKGVQETTGIRRPQGSRDTGIRIPMIIL